MDILITNLEGFDSRRKFMSEQMETLALNFEFINCIDGRPWSEEDVKLLCTPYLFELFQKYQDVWLTKGAIAATQTHVDIIYEKVRKSNSRYTLILEDDVKLDDRFAVLLESLEQELKKDEFEGVLLVHFTTKGTLHLNKSQKQSELGQGGTAYYILTPDQSKQVSSGAAYIISKKAAQKLQHSQRPLRAVADWWGDHVESGAIDDLAVVYPLIATSGNFESTLGYSKKGLKSTLSSALKRIPLFQHVIKYFRRKGLKDSTKVDIRQ